MCVAAFLENLSEPYYVHMLLTGDMQPRIRAECIGILLKSVATYFLLLKNFNLLAYSLSQLLYSISILLFYSYLSGQSFSEREAGSLYGF